VFDGVGGWASLGIDPGLYSRQLAHLTREKLRAYGADSVMRALSEATEENEHVGSSTVCVVSLLDHASQCCLPAEEGEGCDATKIAAAATRGELTPRTASNLTTDKTARGVLCGLNLGDSGVLVVRGSEAVFRTPEQQHYFNCPYQVGSDSIDSVEEDASRVLVSVQAGDFVILGTDGLFDNCFAEDIVSEIEAHLRRRKDKCDVPYLAETLARLAFAYGMDTRRDTPFAMNARDAGHHFMGGKMDDITVIVCRVLRAKQQNKAPPLPPASSSSSRQP